MSATKTCLVAILFVLAAALGPVGVAGAATGQETTEANCSFPVTATDATGTEVTIEEEPQRIVTLAPSAAQTMWEIGGKEKVVGVSQYAGYLAGAGSRTNVSGAGQTYVNTEVVVGLEPDLVLAPEVIPNETVAQLRNAGLTVFKMPHSATIEDVYAKTTLTGRLTGECAGAAETVSWMKERIGTVREAVSGEERPRALYTFFGYTAGKGTFIHEIITTAGGRNVAAAANVSGYARISEEVVATRNPQWLLLNSDGPSVPNSAAYNGTIAMKRNQTVVLNGSYISQPAPRIVHPITKLARAFHPEAYAAANATETTESTPEPTERAAEGATATTSGTSAVETTTGSSGQPGFGAAPALLALLSVGLLARRD